MSHELTPGKMRGLAATSTDAGVFTILAIDHRDSLRIVLQPEDPGSLPAAAVTEVKLDVLRAMAGDASAVMLDPEYGAAQAIAARALPGQVGFLCAVEAQGYLGDPAARQTTLLDGWSVAKAKRLGASAVKLLVLYRPDGGEVTAAQDELVSAVVADCAANDIPLFLEPLGYARDGENPEQLAAARRETVIGSVRRLGALGPDVLKVQFPVDTSWESDRAVWRAACAELDEAAPVPWALLSAGDPFDVFREQVQIACESGASGFMAGRAIWGDVIGLPRERRTEALGAVARPRFRELAGIAATSGRDWGSHCTAPGIDEHWYRRY